MDVPEPATLDTAASGTEPAGAKGETPRIVSGRVMRVRQEPSATVCVLDGGNECTVSPLAGARIQSGDEFSYVALAGVTAPVELLIRKTRVKRTEIFQVAAGYAAQPKQDRKDGWFVRAEATGAHLGIAAIHVRCAAIRDYFFVADRGADWEAQPDLYATLGLRKEASFHELRLAFRLRRMELRRAQASVPAVAALERAFNIAGDPHLRAVYDELQKDAGIAVPFPYSGFGTLLVEGETAREGGIFFARRILAFLPERRKRTFKVPLRRFDFFADYAVLRDRKREVLIDRDLLDIRWDATWSRWRNLISSEVEITAEFVRTGRYCQRAGKWRLNEWEYALPSRTGLVKAEGLDAAIVKAREMHSRFGRYWDRIQSLQELVAKQPVERSDLHRMCAEAGLPGDFDVAEIGWRAEYDRYYFTELAARCRTFYVWRDEYLFDLEHAAVAEIPAAGHATYVFAKPASIQEFVERYAKTTRADIRSNRNNAGDALRFSGRVAHGEDKNLWLRQLCQRTGEPANSQAGSDRSR